MTTQVAIPAIALGLCVLVSGCSDSAGKRAEQVKAAEAKAAAERKAIEERAAAEKKALADKWQNTLKWQKLAAPPAVQPKPSEARKPHIRSSKLLPEEWKAALPGDFPAQLRQGMSDEELARDLELEAWAFDFTGGPLRCWLEFEESGQKTMPARQPTQATGDWEIDVKEGRIVFSVGLSESERMKRIMKQDGKAESVTFGFHWSYRSAAEEKTGGTKVLHGGSPLWFGWPADNKLLSTQTPTVDAPREGEALTLLRIWCVERVPAQKDKPRKATVLLKGAFGMAKKG